MSDPAAAAVAEAPDRSDDRALEPAWPSPPFPRPTPSTAAVEGMQARAGVPAPPDAAPPSPTAVQDALRSVHDPEIPVNIYDLGLIYCCDLDEGGDVAITMTLTAPACPVAGEMPQQVADAVAAVARVGVVTVTLTWTPPWTPERMSEDAKLALDFF